MKLFLVALFLFLLIVLTSCGKPLFYYTGAEQQYGLRELERTLDILKWDSGDYQVDEFDCSEMSAYLERELENRGFRTSMVVGGRSEKGRHVWLMVEFEGQTYIPVEATTSQIIMPDNPKWGNYYEYVTKFNTIEDALKSYKGKTEFDWWNKEN